MERLPEPVERRLSELDELFGPERDAYGESYRERLREDDELSAGVRERFERGKASGQFPVLSDFLSNLSAKEKEIFFKTGGIQAEFSHSLVPEDVGVRFRQLQKLLAFKPEFMTRYPEAHSILLSHRAQRTEHGGLLLPSFGVHILRHEPTLRSFAPEGAIVGDAYSATYGHKPEMGHPPADQSVWSVDAGFLRGVLLAILSREEFSERIFPYAKDPDLFEGVEVPQKSAVRITDLRWATILELEESEQFLHQALRSLQRPITAENIVEWKHRIIGNKAENEADPSGDEFADRSAKRREDKDREPPSPRPFTREGLGRLGSTSRTTMFLKPTFFESQALRPRKQPPRILSDLVQALTDLGLGGFSTHSGSIASSCNQPSCSSTSPRWLRGSVALG